MRTRDLLLSVGSALTILASGLFLWRYASAPPGINHALQQGIGEALADETIRCLDGGGNILVITLAEEDSDVLAAQLAAFTKRIESSAVRIKDVERIDASKSDKYGPGLGLSARKLTREVDKNRRKSAIVSFVGLPELDEAELATLGEAVPPLLAFSRDTDKLGPLSKRGLLHAAVVPRFRFPAPGPASPRTPGEWFTNQYQIVHPAAARAPAH